MEEHYLSTLLKIVPHGDCGKFNIVMAIRLAKELREHIKDIPRCKLELQQALRVHGYMMEEQGMDRFCRNVKRKVYSVKKKINKTHNKYLDSTFTFTASANEIKALQDDAFQTQQQKMATLEQELLDAKETNENQARLLEDLLSENRNMAERKTPHNRKTFGQMSRKQQGRQIKQISENASAALQFAENYNLVPKSLTLKERFTDAEVEVQLESTIKETDNTQEAQEPRDGNHNTAPIDDTDELQLQQDSTLDTETVDKRKAAHDNLPEEEKVRILQHLNILSRNSMSMSCYRKLSKLHPSMPRAYLLEESQKSMDSKWKEVMVDTPGSYSGTQLPFKMLLEKQITQYAESTNINLADQDTTFKVKISGDGTVLSRNSTLFVLTFSLLNEGPVVMSSAGNHTIAVVRGPENFATLKNSLHDVWKQINEVIRDGFILINGHQVKVEIFLGGDYKFLLLALGMKCANSNNSCIYCKVHKKDRSDLSKSREDFEAMKRETGTHWLKDPCCVYEPLLEISLDNCRIDELHLLMRVTDRMEEGIIKDAIDWDEKENAGKPKSQYQTTHEDNLVAAIKSCGVSFSTWKNEKKQEWTSMTGSCKKLVLFNLPGKMQQIIRPEMLQKTKKLWEDFQALYQIITSPQPTEEQVSSFHIKAKDWGKQLVNMGGNNGYSFSCPITPYIHMMIYHVPDMIKGDIPLKMFTGQGVEKKNDEYRKFFHHGINRWNACRALVCLEKRQELLVDHETPVRPYRKRDHGYWFNGGKSAVAQKVLKTQSDVTQQRDI